MKFSAIMLLDPVHRERISRKGNIDAGLIVTEVSVGSIAEKAGIRIGDIVESWDRELVSSTFELENMLWRKCEEHLDNEGSLGSTLKILVGIYCVRKDCRSSVTLTLEVRDAIEVIARGAYDVSTTLSAMVSRDDRDSVQSQNKMTQQKSLDSSTAGDQYISGAAEVP